MSGAAGLGFAGDMTPVGWAVVELCWAKTGAVANMRARLMKLKAREGNLVGEIAEFTGPEWAGVNTSCRRRERDVTETGKRQRFTGHSICVG
jgi:hypothetical protein